MIVHSNKVTKKPGQKPAQVATYRPVMPAAATVGGGVHDKKAEKAVIYSYKRENYTLDNGYVLDLKHKKVPACILLVETSTLPSPIF